MAVETSEGLFCIDTAGRSSRLYCMKFVAKNDVSLHVRPVLIQRTTELSLSSTDIGSRSSFCLSSSTISCRCST
jgi:hypothetical protein